MNDTATKLSRCFSAVFPTLSEEQIPGASVETVQGWDSVAAATLITAIEEEFGIEIEVNTLDSLTSFQSMLDYLIRVSPTTPRSDASMPEQPRG